DEEAGSQQRRGVRWGLAVLAAVVPCAWIPAIGGLPIGGYAAIILILIGSVLIMPALAALTVDRLPMPSRMPAAIALAQLRATPRQSAISIAAIVISMSLMASMLIMVHSFRSSLDAWLAQMLPADLYLRAGAGGETGYFTPEIQAELAATPGVVRAEFLRSQTLLLDAARAPATLLARVIDEAHPEETLPLSDGAIHPGPGEPPPVWVSEAASDLYALRVGAHVTLPIGGERQRFTVAGIWRDYARQNGAIAMARTRYIALTGDRLANDAALWLAPGVAPSAAQAAVRQRLGDASGVEISSAREVRATSLALFDRTFAITYALEAAAIIVGLFGVSVSFSAQALARRREFGVLRHLGMTRRDIAIMLGIEGAIITALGAALGLLVGWIASLILVHVVNRQSFHWSMEMHLPWTALAALACGVVAAAALTAVLSGWPATRADAVRAVREDW
ncbi:MAG TPA: ABC transporter permease, partial [Burkholderiales bacterium]|nr:ABC transporter permease [Burkholderiales bacterium]